MSRRFWHHGLDQFRTVTLTEHYRIAANPFSFRIGIKVFRHRGERPRQIDVVTVNESEDVPGAFLDTFIYRVDLSAVLFAGPIGQAIFIPSNYLDGFIRTAPVDNDVLEIRILLV